MDTWKAGPDVMTQVSTLIGQYHPHLALIEDELAVASLKDGRTSPDLDSKRMPNLVSSVGRSATSPSESPSSQPSAAAQKCARRRGWLASRHKSITREVGSAWVTMRSRRELCRR